MRAIGWLFIVLACAGCSRFENPIVGEDGPALDDALIGRWAADSGDEHVELRIERAGDGGLAALTGFKDGKAQEDRFHLITSRVGNLSFLSAQSAERADPTNPEERPGSWYYFRYELPTPDRLVLYADDGDRWRGAVLDGLVEGTADPKNKTFSVTASSGELREFLEGYGSVIFKDEAAAEFHRATKD